MIGFTLDDIRTVVREEISATLKVKYLDVEAAAEYTGFTVETLRNAVSQKRLTRVGEHGTALRFRRQDLDEYLARRTGRSA